MTTACEFRNCKNTSDDTKVNRLRIHENLARKWNQVFGECLDDRIGEYLYICGAHFDKNTKKLILPQPLKANRETKEAPARASVIVKKEVSHEPVKKRAAAVEARQKTKSWSNDASDSDNEPLAYKAKPVIKEDTYLPEQMFIEVEMEEILMPEIKQEIVEGEILPAIHEEARERSPINHHAPDLTSLVPDTMKPHVVLSSNLEKFEKSKKNRDKKRYDKMVKELKSLKGAVEKERMKNEFLERDVVITKNRIKFIERNFGGASARRNS